MLDLKLSDKQSSGEMAIGPDLTIEAIEEARLRIAPYVRRTPLLSRPSLAGELPPALRLKLENLQLSGSFKVRGVFNTLLQLAPEQRQHGVVGSSAGNHGVALAYCAATLGLPATVYLPTTASEDRVARIARWGAQVIRHGSVWDEAHARGLAEATARGAAYIHPFADQTVLAGQGTLGLELFSDLPDLDCVVVAVGGGGLIGGIAAAIKQRRPTARIIGVEPAGADSLRRSLAAGAVVTLDRVQTIADTLAPRACAPSTLALAQRYVDRVVTVDDGQLLRAMRWLWLECNQLVEPAGAAVIAALQADPSLVADCTRPVALICGGNAAAECVFQHYGG